MTEYKTIFIKNIYCMLCYAFTNLKFKDIKNISAEEFKNFQNLFAKILSEEIGRQLKQGLSRKYLNLRENISTVRGKIILQNTMQNFISGRRKIFCEFDELSENNLLNQILKATAALFLHDENVEEIYKKFLRNELLFFSNVEKILPDAIQWNKIHFLKNNRSYEMLINFCRLILEEMILTTEDGELKLKTFGEENLPHLYEKFLLAYYRKHFPHLNPQSKQIDWALDDGEKIFLPKMQSDVMLSTDDKVLIIDAKFYSKTLQKYFGAEKIISENLYQIFAYVKNFSATTSKKVSGLLLYARTDEKFLSDVTYKISGNKISVKTLDLNKNFSEIEKQLKNIVEKNFLM